MLLRRKRVQHKPQEHQPQEHQPLEEHQPQERKLEERKLEEHQPQERKLEEENLGKARGLVGLQDLSQTLLLRTTSFCFGFILCRMAYSDGLLGSCNLLLFVPLSASPVIWSSTESRHAILFFQPIRDTASA